MMMMQLQLFWYIVVFIISTSLGTTTTTTTALLIPNKSRQYGGHVFERGNVVRSKNLIDQHNSRSSCIVSFRGGGTELHLSSSLPSMYGYVMEHHFLLTQSVTFAIFCSLGDILAQRMDIQKSKQKGKEEVEDGSSSSSSSSSSAMNMKKHHDWQRTRRFFYKGLGCGIIWTYWYRIAESWSSSITTRALTWLNPTTNTGGVVAAERSMGIIKTLSSILLEQFVASPLIFSMWDIPVLSMMLGTPARQVPNAVRAKLGKMLLANAKLWTFANMIIYNIPLHFRVFVLSGFDLIWQIITSTIASQKIPEPVQK